FGRGAVFIGGADIEDVMPPRPHETRPNIGGQHRPGQIPKVLDAVDVGQRRGDEDTGHDVPTSDREASDIEGETPRVTFSLPFVEREGQACLTAAARCARSARSAARPRSGWRRSPTRPVRPPRSGAPGTSPAGS